MTSFIFLPGASGRTEFWQPVRKRLIDLLRLDPSDTQIQAYPEFDGCPSVPQVYNFQSLQHYVLDQIEKPSVLIAQSMGGIFAVHATLQKPQYIQALVLVATSGGIDLSPFQVADWRKDYVDQFEVPSWFVDEHQKLDVQLSKIQCPVLLIWGDADPISPVSVGQYLNQKIAHSHLVIIEQGQHDLASQYADRVSRHITDFLNQISLETNEL